MPRQGRVYRPLFIAIWYLATFPEVALTLSRHLAHDFWSIDEEEECSRLIGHGSSDERLSRPRRSIEENTSRWLYTNGTEQLRVAEGELHHLGIWRGEGGHQKRLNHTYQEIYLKSI